MRKLSMIMLLCVAAPLMGMSNAQASELNKDTRLGTSIEEVKSTLSQMGYEVRKAEMEDGNIEVYFVSGKNMGEVYVNPQTGMPVKLKMK